ncbi:MAG: transporter-like protein [Devosia sp.]|uniref:ABC transporter ATP-binding protein n=1 Tax=Devosia sp. TaxID=1871048 RepID=UPI002639C7D2|nr:sn-glycerol-3-phosphate ABC transporter ATP-binding protein UgpC [Devosia sp.]MDB5586453.1 transporter-like protein [Devosia sp.]
MAQLSLRKVIKAYQEHQVVRGIDLEVADKEFVVLVGPSGCGKSTTLRMIAGLEHISGGQIAIDERVVNDLGPGERDIAMVFQNYALYPHMSVAENIAFCLQQKKMPKEQIAQRIATAAQTLHISDLLERRPGQLSGGQRQRVAMGRAIVRNPKVFLFDEPLSNLDAKLRVQMRTEIKRLHQALPTTTVYVTHDQIEAMTMADRVVVMNKGRIEQVGPPQELYHRPVSLFVAGFIGSPAMNLLPARVAFGADAISLVLADGTALALPPAMRSPALTEGRQVIVGIRPETISQPVGRQNAAPILVNVDIVEPLGVETLLYFNIGEIVVCARVIPEAAPPSRQQMALSIDMEKIHIFDPQTEQAIRPDVRF